MKNIEIKTPVDSHEAIERKLVEIGAAKTWCRWQRDTFFNTSNGWLKIREAEGCAGELIGYERPVDESGPRPSTYDLFDLQEVERWRGMLERVLGTKQVVEKTRTLWIWKQTRIHLDRVNQLGEFLELEAVAKEITLEEAYDQAEFMIRELDLDAANFISVPYAEMLLGNSVS